MGNIFNTIRNTDVMSDRIRVDVTESISDDILQDNIVEQIRNLNKNIEKNNNNFVESFQLRLNSINELYHDDEKLQRMIHSIKNNFYSTILEELQLKYQFTLDFRDNLLSNEQHSVVAELYNFLVADLYDNIVNYAVNKILGSIDNILYEYSDKVTTKNNIFKSLLAKYSENTAIILYHISDIINKIDIDNMYDFVKISTMRDTDEYTNMMVLNIFDELDTYVDLGITPGEPKFLKEILDNNYALRQDISNKLINLYKD